MSIETEILQWSTKRPLWLRDMLRRLMRGDEIDESAFDDLVKMCKTEAGWPYSSFDIVNPQALDETHLQTDRSFSLPVRLLEVSGVKNVNAIRSSNPLRMRERGLTIVYGPNGSGKTGYVRILRKVCGPRASNKDILPNVFSDIPADEKSAILKVKVGDIERLIHWPSEAEANPALRNITVFDSESASTYVNDDNEVVYAPFGLIVLDRLAKLCIRIRGRIDEELSRLGTQLPHMPIGYQLTSEYRWLSEISADTTNSEIEDYTQFDSAMESELGSIASALAEPDPIAKANEIDFEIAKLRRLQQKLREIHDALDVESLSELRRLKNEKGEAEEASRLAATSLKDSSMLKGIGSQTWILLWEAARRFSTECAYPEQKYPVVTPGSQCVLCQQPLSDSAGRRMQTLESFVAGVVARRREEIISQLDEALRLFRNSTRIEPDHLQTIEGLKASHPKIVRWILAFVKLCEARQRAVIAELDTGAVSTLPKLHSFSIDIFSTITNIMENQRDTLKRSTDAGQREALSSRRLSLQARKWLAENRPSIDREIERLRSVRILTKAKASTDTTSITKFCDDLTEKYITDKLKEEFAAQIKHLSGSMISIEITKTAPRYGTPYHKIVLCNIGDADHKVCDVLSEGELRLIGLAAFLAELSLTPSKSAVVFDDPVSSFDHRIRDRVAKAIISLAADRQVVVFTHDLFLLSCLIESREVSCQEISKVGQYSGICTDDVPWDATKVQKRIGLIKELLQQAVSCEKSADIPRLKNLQDQIHNRMRQTVERLVEDVLIDGIVKRYRRSVQTQHIQNLLAITENDCIIVEDLMTKYSAPVHDQSPEVLYTPPPLRDIQEDINKMENLIKGMEQRRKRHEKSATTK